MNSERERVRGWDVHVGLPAGSDGVSLAEVLTSNRPVPIACSLVSVYDQMLNKFVRFAFLSDFRFP